MGEPGVVDQNVDRAKFPANRRQGIVASSRIGDVADDPERRDSAFLEVADRANGGFVESRTAMRAPALPNAAASADPSPPPPPVITTVACRNDLGEWRRVALFRLVIARCPACVRFDDRTPRRWSVPVCTRMRS